MNKPTSNMPALPDLPEPQPSSLDELWRPEVVAFANAMERKLQANDWKGGWKNDQPYDLMARVHEELTEFKDEFGWYMGNRRELTFTARPTPQYDQTLAKLEENRLQLLGEAADVANMLMMVVDVCGALKAGAGAQHEALRPDAVERSADTPAPEPSAHPDAGILEIHRIEGARMRVTDEMVSRFLGWPLPENFNPDGGITFKRTFNDGTPYEGIRHPSGTNLLDAEQARAMLEHVLGIAAGAGK